MTSRVNRLAYTDLKPPIRDGEKKTGYLQSIGNGIAKVWSVVWEQGCIAMQMITSVFFRCVSWISPTWADKLEIFWGHITATYLRVKAALREKQLQGELQAEINHNQDLNGYISQLATKVEESRIEVDHLIWQRDLALSQFNEVNKEVEELILARAPILIERDHLLEEKQELSQQLSLSERKNQQLVLELEESLKAKTSLVEESNRDLEELGTLRAQTEFADDYKKIKDYLAEFSRLYAQIDKSGSGSATQFALEKLLPLCKAHKTKLHGRLEKEIKDLPIGNREMRASLNGLLRLSQKDMEHQVEISKALHLLKELRLPLAQSVLNQ